MWKPGTTPSTPPAPPASYWPSAPTASTPIASSTPTAAPTSTPSGSTGVGRPEFIKEPVKYFPTYIDNTFRPDVLMTRSDMAVLLFNVTLDDSKNTLISPIFNDVSAVASYAQAIAYLTKRGVLSGYGDGTFKPDNPVTRAEFATMLSFFTDTAALPVSYADVQSNAWYYQYISKMHATGWMIGYPDGTFKPLQHITRAEAASALNRVLGRRAATPSTLVFKDVPASHWAFADIYEASFTIGTLPTP